MADDESLKSAGASSPASPSSVSADEADISTRQMQEIATSGVECDVQMLYPGPPKCNCCTNWVEEYPSNLRSTVAQESESKRKALVVRMGVNHGEGKPLALDSIVVQNQHIKDLLGDVFEGYGGITTNLKKLVFRAPFHAFYYRWARFQDLLARQKQEDEGASAYSQLLYNIVEHELKEPMEEASDLCTKGVITFELLWTLFKPGDRVYSYVNELDRFFVVTSTEYYGPMFKVHAIHTDWNGHTFGFYATVLSIKAFSGTMKITDLNVHPSSYRTDESLMEDALRARGKKFYDLRGVQYKAYRASALLAGRKGGFTGKQVNGRIVIDVSLAPTPFNVGGLVDLDDSSMGPRIDVSERPSHHHPPMGMGSVPQPGPHGPGIPPGVQMPNVVPPPVLHRYERPVRSRARRLRRSVSLSDWSDMEEGSEGSSPEKATAQPSDEHLMLSSGHVRAYSLVDKCWGLFDVDSVEEIEWNEDAFPNLHLPEGHKDLILAFVDGQLSKSQTFDDIIQGKGLGLTMLLVGSPGTGKTLTAEAVADRLHKPLYMLSAGELGQDAESVEDKLSSTLRMTEKWGAILLLDECDVFLEKRSHSHMGHNEVVAVFLRTLEYYPGMLFLTTNRGEAIDAAFQSRIHLTLHYPELSTDAKYHIWHQFLTRAGSNTLAPLEMSKLANLTLNGRQIKNIVKTASLLARSQGSPSIQVKNIETVLKVTNQEGQTLEQKGGHADGQVILSYNPL
ncbi:P-loop containing nucleoside triphosphate hydrolase protein [Apiospora sp. TS-2023a]